MFYLAGGYALLDLLKQSPPSKVCMHENMEIIVLSSLEVCSLLVAPLKALSAFEDIRVGLLYSEIQSLVSDISLDG